MNWHQCKNILCIRADNMGDVLMTTPAFRALKETFGCRLTLLTSKAGGLITPFIEEIDETIIYDLPWVKTNKAVKGDDCLKLIEDLKKYNFDGAIIFTVFSQSPLPSAMLACMASIPLRAAYCRENPYDLLTTWIPDKEPYSFVQHQVERDLSLVKSIGAFTQNENLSIRFDEHAFISATKKIKTLGFDQSMKYCVVHAGVSENKREYPAELWIETVKNIQQQTDMQILLTGAETERSLTQKIQFAAGENVFSVAGILNIEEFIATIAHAAVIISVNTATIHIAAALKKPVIVLYALTNPQHTPWLTENIVLPFSVPEKLKSKNEVIQFVNEYYFKKDIEYPSPQTISDNVFALMNSETEKINMQSVITT